MTTKERTKIVIDGIVVTLIPRTGEDARDRRKYYAKTRVYGAIDALAPDLTVLEPQWVSEPVGVEVDDATRIKGKIWRAWRDGTKKIVSQRLSELVSKLRETQDFQRSELSSDAVTFSYKAGCSCGCSPGFILDGKVRSDWTPCDIWLSREDEEEAGE